MVVLIKAILFDLYDTLGHFDVEDAEYLHERRIGDVVDFLQSQRIEIDVKKFKQFFTEILSTVSKKSDEESVEITIDQILIQTFRKLNIPHMDAGALKGIEKAFYHVLEERWILYDDTLETLKKLLNRHFQMAIVSNIRSDMFVREIVKKLDIDIYFQAIITSAQLGIRKPRPEPFLTALNQLNMEARQAAVVGDTLKADVQGGTALGMKTIYVNRKGIEIPNIKADAVIKNLTELLDLLNKWNSL